MSITMAGMSCTARKHFCLFMDGLSFHNFSYPCFRQPIATSQFSMVESRELRSDLFITLLAEQAFDLSTIEISSIEMPGELQGELHAKQPRNFLIIFRKIIYLHLIGDLGYPIFRHRTPPLMILNPTGFLYSIGQCIWMYSVIRGSVKCRVHQAGPWIFFMWFSKSFFNPSMARYAS